MINYEKNRKGLKALPVFCEIFNCTNLQFHCSFLITNYCTVRMHLKGRKGPHMADTVFNYFFKCTSFLVTINYNYYFAGIKNGLYTNSNCPFGNLIKVVIKKS